MAGLSSLQRKTYGVYPLQGKLLNVRIASQKSIKKNRELQNIKTIIGLKDETSYTTTDSLRYKHVMIMTDQDEDGVHIKGLLINFFHHNWPQLLKLNPPFLSEFRTPIVKVISYYILVVHSRQTSVNNCYIVLRLRIEMELKPSHFTRWLSTLNGKNKRQIIYLNGRQHITRFALS